MHLAKPQISLPSVQSDQASLYAYGRFGSLATHNVLCEDWSARLRWLHKQFVWNAVPRLLSNRNSRPRLSSHDSFFSQFWHIAKINLWITVAILKFLRYMISPFLLVTMSVRLIILTCHWFKVYEWSFAWVRWPHISWCQQKGLVTLDSCCKVQKIPLI